MDKQQLIKELVIDVKSACYRGLVDDYEANQVDHLANHFKLTNDLDSQWLSFVKNRCENRDRFPLVFRRIYQQFSEKWKESNERI